MLLMLVGNAGFVTVISTSMLTVLKWEESRWWSVPLIGGGGVVTLVALSRSRWVDRRMHRLISGLLKRYTTLDVRDYVGLLKLSGEYQVMEMLVEADHWLADRNLLEVSLREEGIMVLGINRADGTYVGAPRGATSIHSGDNIILYGKSGMCERLEKRQRGFEGERLHRQAVEEQKRELEEQEIQEALAE